MRSLALVLLSTLVALPALASPPQWKAIEQPTNKDDYLLAVDVLSDLQFVTGGMRFSSGGMIPIPSTVLYRSQDGGKLVQTLKIGSAGGIGGGAVSVLAFTSLANGLAAMGGDVWKTTNGTTFQQVTLDAEKEIKALHRMNAQKGVAVGTEGGIWRTTDGGTTWAAVDSGTTADLDCVTFINDRTGWVAGSVKKVTEDGETMDGIVSYSGIVVLGTSDGGATWTELATIPADAADGDGGRQSCPIHFLPDGQTGWLVTSIFDLSKQRAKEVILLRTTDGGSNWRDMKVDFKVGVLNFMMKMDIKLSYAAGMYWSDDGRMGHLVGAADTGMESGGGMGGSTPVYKTVDMTTKDGGKTWTKPDFGEIKMDFGGGAAPEGDPRPAKAVFGHWAQGVMVGEKGNVWIWEALCDRDSACPEGYKCLKPDPKVPAKCYPKAADPDATGPDAAGSDNATDRDAFTTFDGAGEGGTVSLDLPACEGDDCPSGRSGGGCAGSGTPVGPGAWPAATLLMVYLLASRRFRR